MIFFHLFCMPISLICKYFQFICIYIVFIKSIYFIQYVIDCGFFLFLCSLFGWKCQTMIHFGSYITLDIYLCLVRINIRQYDKLLIRISTSHNIYYRNRVLWVRTIFVGVVPRSVFKVRVATL